MLPEMSSHKTEKQATISTITMINKGVYPANEWNSR